MRMRAPVCAHTYKTLVTHFIKCSIGFDDYDSAIRRTVLIQFVLLKPRR